MSRSQIPKPTLAAASALVVFVGFVGGILIAYDNGDADQVASPATTSTSIAPTSLVPTTTSAPPRPAVTPAPVERTTTEPPAPTAAAPSTTTTPPPEPPTSAPAPAPTDPPAPAALEVRYSRDSAGNMLVPRTGSSVVVVRNIGGSVGSYTVQAVGWVTAEGLTQVTGTVGPGESRAISITAAPGAPSAGPTGTVTVYDAGGPILSIPALVV